MTACDEQVGHGANASNSYNTCIRSTDVVSGLYLQSMHSGRNVFEVEVDVHGVIMKVVVLAMVVEVVVHGRGGSSGSLLYLCFGAVLSDSRK